VVRGYVLAARVSNWTGNEDGGVIFMDGDSQLGTAVLDKTGTATYQSPSLTLGLHYLTAYFPGTTTQAASASPVLTENIPTDVPDFSIGLSSPSIIVLTGAMAQVQVNILPLNQFGGNVALACSTGTPFLNCSLYPEVVQGGSGFSMLTITTSATGNRTSSISSRLARMAAWLSSTFILSFVFLGRRRGTVSMVSLIALLAVAITLGCGSSSSSGAKAGNLHAITITASSGQLGPVIIHVAKLQVEAAPN